MFIKTFATLLLFTLCLNASSNRLKTIAFAQDDMSNDFRIAQVYEARDEVKKHSDIKFVYSNAKGKVSLLIRNIQRHIDAKVDLLIISTNDSNTVIPIISKAYESGIPIILLDRGINSDKYTTFLASDNFAIGKLAAEYIVEKIAKEGNVLLIEGILQADVTQHRTQGFLSEMQKYENIKITKITGNYLRKDSIIEMQKLIKQGKTFDAIFSESDSMLSGVRAAEHKFKIDSSSTITIGVDFITESKEAIANNRQTASIKYPLGGKEAVEVAVKILSGQEVAKKIILPTKLITKENFERENPIF